MKCYSSECSTLTISFGMCLHNNKLCSAATEVSGCQLMLIGVEAGYKASFNYVSSIT